MAWNYLRYFRLEVPLQFPCHGMMTTRRDTVHMVSEGTTGVFGWQRALWATQFATGVGGPGVYYQTYTNGVPQELTLVQAFGGQAVAGTLVWEVTADPAGSGGSRSVVTWEGVLLEDTVSATNLASASENGNYHHPACYVISNPMYVASTDSFGNVTWAFAESVRVGPLGGRVYGDPDAQGVSHSRGARTWNFADWWAAMGYAVPEIATMTNSWNNVKRGSWAGYVFPGRHWTVSETGMMWGDGVTVVRPTLPLNDYLQLYLFGEIVGSSIAAVTDRANRTKVSWVDNETTVLFRLVERPADLSTWQAPVTIYTGTQVAHPALAAYDDGTVTCWYMVAGQQHASLSTDDGRTWTELTTMMGSSLRNVAVTQHHGITLGVGVSGSNLYFVRSNDQGRTQDAQPGGVSMQLVGTCGADCRPAITWYPDGEVAVWAEDADGTTIAYHNASSGYGTWSAVS